MGPGISRPTVRRRRAARRPCRFRAPVRQCRPANNPRRPFPPCRSRLRLPRRLCRRCQPNRVSPDRRPPRRPCRRFRVVPQGPMAPGFRRLRLRLSRLFPLLRLLPQLPLCPSLGMEPMRRSRNRSRMGPIRPLAFPARRVARRTSRPPDRVDRVFRCRPPVRASLSRLVFPVACRESPRLRNEVWAAVRSPRSPAASWRSSSWWRWRSSSRTSPR